jgi:hypothetical protein
MTTITALSAPSTSLYFAPKLIPDFFQYLFVFFLVIVMFAMKEYVNQGIYRIKDQLDDLQKK